MIYFSEFSVATGPTTDVVMAVQDFATGTATGAQSFTSATITGVTPKAVLLLNPNHDPTNDPNETAVFSLGIGMVSGTNDFHTGATNRDNNASTSNGRFGNTSRAYEVLNNSGSSIKNAAGQTVSGGVELNFAANAAPSLRGAFAAFAGADVSGHANQKGLGTGTAAIDVTDPAFQPDVVIVMDKIAGLSLGMTYGFGIAVNDGSNTQRCVMWAEANALADSRPFQQLRNDCAYGKLSTTTGAPSYKVVVDGFDANGFNFTPSASSGSETIAYMALKFTGRQFKLVDFSTPTATGSHTVTGAGFTPRFALAVLTNLEAINNDPASTTSDLQSGFAVCLIGSDEQWSVSHRINAGEATTDAASQLSAVALMGASATDCDAIKATFTAWTSDGVTLNFSATQGTAKKGFILFVE